MAVIRLIIDDFMSMTHNQQISLNIDGLKEIWATKDGLSVIFEFETDEHACKFSKTVVKFGRLLSESLLRCDYRPNETGHFRGFSLKQIGYVDRLESIYDAIRLIGNLTS